MTSKHLNLTKQTTEPLYNQNVDKSALLTKIDKIKDAEMTYALIDCPNMDFEVFNIQESASKKGGVSKIRKEEELLKYFSGFRKDILKRKEACYALYDFGFYIDESKENYRTALILVIYVPDTLKPRQKVFYSVSAKELLSIIGINKSITITTPECLTYEKFLEEVKLHQKH
ncbi:hypothetical protein CDIK_0951 [Cucumispora dikerogammari]|nr:hypothetical protein CDIK_0951 [Cucumispora dikerogammari]